MSEPKEPKVKEYLAKLVGNNFRESGRAVLPILSAGTPLILEPEPSNPYDPDAIRVLVDMTGHRFSPTNTGPIIHLGYIPRRRDHVGNPLLRLDPNLAGQDIFLTTLEVRHIMAEPNWTAGLDFEMTGAPLVRITVLLDQDEDDHLP